MKNALIKKSSLKNRSEGSVLNYEINYETNMLDAFLATKLISVKLAPSPDDDFVIMECHAYIGNE